jgi:hypothetical protein
MYDDGTGPVDFLISDLVEAPNIVGGPAGRCSPDSSVSGTCDGPVTKAVKNGQSWTRNSKALFLVPRA